MKSLLLKLPLETFFGNPMFVVALLGPPHPDIMNLGCPLRLRLMDEYLFSEVELTDFIPIHSIQKMVER